MKKFINTRVANAIFAMVLVFITNSIFAQTTTLGGYKVFTNGKANNFIVPENTYKGKAAYPKTGPDIAVAFDTYERAPFFRLTSKEHILVLIIGFNNSVRVISKAMGVPNLDTIAHNNYRRMIEIMNQSKRERYTYPLGTLFAALDPKDSSVVWISIPNDSLRNSLVFYTPDNIRIPVAHWECGAQPPFLEDLTETEKCLIKIDTVTVNNLKAPPPPIIPPAPKTQVVYDTCCEGDTYINYNYYGTTQAPQKKQYVDYGYRSEQPLYWGVDYCGGRGRNYDRYYQGGGCYDCGGYDWGFSISFGWSPSRCYERANNNYCCAPNWEHDNYSQVGDYYYNYEDNDVTNVTNIYNIDNSTHVDDHSTHTTTTTTGTTPGGTSPVTVYPDKEPAFSDGSTGTNTTTTTTDGSTGTGTGTNDGSTGTNPVTVFGDGSTGTSGKTDETSFITSDGKLRKQSTEITYKKNGQVKAITTKYSEEPATQADIMKYGSPQQQAELTTKSVQPKNDASVLGATASNQQLGQKNNTPNSFGNKNSVPVTQPKSFSTPIQQQSTNAAADKWNKALAGNVEQKVTPQNSVGQNSGQQNIPTKGNNPTTNAPIGNSLSNTQGYDANGKKVSPNTNMNVANSNVAPQKYDVNGRKISPSATASANDANFYNNTEKFDPRTNSANQKYQSPNTNGLSNSPQPNKVGTNDSKPNTQQQPVQVSKGSNNSGPKQTAAPKQQPKQVTQQPREQKPQAKQPQQTKPIVQNRQSPQQQRKAPAPHNGGGGSSKMLSRK